jgi:putative addiction module killer protein
MIEVRETTQYNKWFVGLRDLRAKVQIARRIERAQSGNLGDVKFFDGIGEMRIDHGPGYRLYFVQRGRELIILLGGGDKKSQDRDIREAIRLAKEA